MANKKIIKAEGIQKVSALPNRKASVIKGNSVLTNTPVKIQPEKGRMIQKSNSAIKPIVENDEIVGIIYQCECGKITEIKFEFEDD